MVKTIVNFIIGIMFPTNEFVGFCDLRSQKKAIMI